MSCITATIEQPAIRLPIVDGEYRTAERRVSWFSRTFPSISFFSKMVSIVFRASFKAKRGKYDCLAWAESSLEVLRALESVGVQFEITGLEQLESVDGPCVIVGNHLSTLETMILPGLVRPYRPVTFVVKRQLIEYPVFKHVMRSRDPIAVSQSDPRGDLKLMLTGGMERLERGVSLIIFPEGERFGGFDPKQFNSIGVKLAGRAKVPIIPVALKTDAWPVGKLISDFGRIDPSKKVHFAFGKPLTVEGRGTDEHQEVIEYISGKLAEWE